MNLHRARQLIDEDRLVEAREIIVQALHHNYDNATAWSLLLECPRDREEYGRALREILRIDPENEEARQMAIALARGGGDAEPSDSDLPDEVIGRRRKKSGPLAILTRIIVNTLGLLVVIGIAGGIAYLWLDWQNDSEPTVLIPATIDPVQACIVDVPVVYERLPARCPLVERGEACLINSSVLIDSKTGQTDLLTLAGDRTLITNLNLLETESFKQDDLSWGLVELQAQASYDVDSIFNVRMVATSGVRLRFFDEQMQQISFSSNPVASACPALAPAGLLFDTPPNQSVELEINGEDFLLTGTSFMQVDAAAGLRVIVMTGEISLINRDITVGSGQWVKIPVEGTLATIDVESAEVFGSTPTLRGEVSNLFVLGDALGLATGLWRIPGVSAPEIVTTTPDVNALATASALPPTLVPSATLTITPIPSIEDSPTATAEPATATPSEIPPTPTLFGIGVDDNITATSEITLPPDN